MYRICVIILIFPLLFSCGNAKKAPREGVSVVYRTTPQVTEKDIRHHISVLASDSLQGRKAGTVREEMAAGYIANYFAAFNLKKIYNDYYQSFTFAPRGNKFTCELSFDTPDSAPKKKDANISSFETSVISGGVVFVGCGCAYLDGTYSADAYQDMGLLYNWLMFFEEDAEHENAYPQIAFESLMRYTFSQKTGLTGVLVVDRDYQVCDPLSPQLYFVLSEKGSMPMIRISEQTANEILGYAHTTTEKMQDSIAQLQAQRVKMDIRIPLPVTVNATISLQNDTLHSRNVVGYLEGRDSVLKDEYIVLGAHYDHLGTRWAYDFSDEQRWIYNGADDNASGVAGLLELAEKLSSDKQLKRSVIFIAFGAEEEGLKGAYHITDHLPVEVSKIKLMVNLDMIGRLDSGKLMANTVQKSVPIENALQEMSDAHPDLNLNFSSNQWGNSDHFPFYRRNIPVVMFSTGIHNEYHTPQDTLGTINIAGEKKILDLVYDFIVLNAEKTGVE